MGSLSQMGFTLCTWLDVGFSALLGVTTANAGNFLNTAQIRASGDFLIVLN